MQEDRSTSVDAGLPVSNKSTAQWRVYTNLARDLWQKVLPFLGIWPILDFRMDSQLASVNCGM